MQVSNYERGLRVNHAKIQYFFASRKYVGMENKSILLNGVNSEKCDNFQCFGIIVTRNNYMKEEIKVRIRLVIEPIGLL